MAGRKKADCWQAPFLKKAICKVQDVVSDCKLIFFSFSCYNIGAANKGQSTVNYRQYLAFHHPYLSRNDHCDW